MSRYRESSFERRSPRERDYGYRRDYDYRDSRNRYGGRSTFVPRQNKVPNPKPSHVLGVFGLSRVTKERDIYHIMSQYGQVKDIQIIYDNLSGASRGFGFVYFASVDEAREALTACSRGLELHGRDIRVDYSLTESAHASTPGVYMGRENRRSDFGGGDRRFARRYRSRSGSYMSPPRHRRSRYASRSRSRSPIPPPMAMMRGQSISRSPSPRMRPRNGGGFSDRVKPMNRWSNGSDSLQ